MFRVGLGLAWAGLGLGLDSPLGLEFPILQIHPYIFLGRGDGVSI